MDKSKKAKKSKIASSSQATSKGRDVTDSSNAARDKAVRDRTVSVQQAADLAASSIGEEFEVELNRLRHENQELHELKRRHEAELSALRRSNAEAMEFVNSLREVNRGSAGMWFCIISTGCRFCVLIRRLQKFA